MEFINLIKPIKLLNLKHLKYLIKDIKIWPKGIARKKLIKLKEKKRENVAKKNLTLKEIVKYDQSLEKIIKQERVSNDMLIFQSAVSINYNFWLNIIGHNIKKIIAHNLCSLEVINFYLIKRNF